MMKGRIKKGNLRRIGREFHQGSDSLKIGWIMQGGKWYQRFYGIQHLLVDQYWFGEFRSAVDHAVRTSGKIGKCLQVSMATQLPQDHLQCLMVVCYPHRHTLFPGFVQQGRRAPLLTDPFHQPGNNLPDTVADVKEGIFQGGAAGVEDKEFHARCSPFSMAAWTAVMAIVWTISSTRQPRLRSLTGFRMPCIIGPMAMAPALRCTAL